MSGALSAQSGTRLRFMDLARGLAVAGMILMHLVPTEGAVTPLGRACTGLARLLEGKPAALFFMLAGMAWAVQAGRAQDAETLRRYVARRFLALSALGVLLHVTVWPTEVLVPMAVMMVLSLSIRRAGTACVWASAVMLAAFSFLAAPWLQSLSQRDWMDSGSHLADVGFGWPTWRYLLLDGNYPVIPWLAFPLVGMALLDSMKASKRRGSAWILAGLAGAGLGWAFSAFGSTHLTAAEGGSPYLQYAWVPTSLSFVLVNGGLALTLIMAVGGLGSHRGREKAGSEDDPEGVQKVSQGLSEATPLVRRRLGLWTPEGSHHLGVRVPQILGSVATSLEAIGRTSLTHYVVHILTVIVPLRLWYPQEEWPTRVGVTCLLAYLVVAIPATRFWLRTHKRGPIEGLLAWLSGPLTSRRSSISPG